MAYWDRKKMSGVVKPRVVKPGDGINTFVNVLEIDDTEASESLNVSNRDYPALSPRPGTTSVYGSAATPLSGVNAAYARDGDEFHVVEGTTWKYWNGAAYTNVAVGLADAQASFLEFTTAAKKYSIMFNGTEKKYWDGSSVADIADANCPATNIIAANDNRMFALKDSSVSTSDIGDITNWTSGDADKIGLYGMKGSGVALRVFNDMIIAFSDRSMHIIFGKIKDEFDPTEPMDVGCVSNKSVLIHGRTGTLYWLDYNRFMGFSGGVPFDVSQKAVGYLEDINYDYKSTIVSGQNGKYIYLSFPYKLSTVNNLTLEYDTERRNWHVWDIGFTEFFNMGETLYGVATSGVIMKLEQGTADDSTVITWSHIMGVSDWLPLKNLKHITDMYALVDLPIGSTLVLEYSTSVDNDDFQTLYTFTPNKDEQTTRVRIPATILQRVNYYRVKFSGTGPCKVHCLEIYGRRGE